MKTIFFFVAIVASVAYAQIKAPLASRSERTAELQQSLTGNSFTEGAAGAATLDTMVTLQDEIIANGGCNLNLCYGLDGSNLISDTDYELQRFFVQLVAATIAIDPRTKMSAYQYGLRLRRISEYTSDIDQFLINLEDAKRNPTLSRSFLAPALFQCQRDFRASPEDANKIVLIGDGNTNYGSEDSTVRVAEQFLPPNNNGDICAVYVGEPNGNFLLRITQNPDRLLDVED
eukprot:IDg8013t1